MKSLLLLPAAYSQDCRGFCLWKSQVKARFITGSLRPWLLFILIHLLTSGNLLHGQSLSEASKVSLITIGPGEELYAGFGHSVLWVSDPVSGIDRAFNYGTFSFETGNFYLKFLRGTLPYQLSVHPLEPQVQYWQRENRSIKQQELALSIAQKERLLQLLETNYLPENREYHYKFFYDNCSTRIQDILREACGDSLIYKGYTGTPKSFRQWIDQYAYLQNPWADFGMDLAIGSPSDAVATPLEATFLPDNLSSAFTEAQLITSDGQVALVKSEQMIYEAAPVVSRLWLTPTVFFWGLAVLMAMLTWWQLEKKIINFMVDRVLFLLTGLTGWVIAALWLGTNHGVTSYNWDILWAFPLWLPLAFLIKKSKTPPGWFQSYLIAYAVLLVASTGNLQKHNMILIPILIILTVRVYYLNNVLFKISQTPKKR